MIIDRTDSTNAGVTLNQVGMDEAQRILKLLDAAIVKSRRSRRDIERKLGWSQGYLGSLLRGRIGLKVWHVFALSRELGLEPMSFFLTVAPPRDPGWILQQLGIEPPPKPEKPAPKKETVPFDREELEEMMRKLLYDELSRLGLLDAEREPYEELEPS
jgi:hypothetical protein